MAPTTPSPSESPLKSQARLLVGLERSSLIVRTRESNRPEIQITSTTEGRQALMDDIAVRRAWLEAAMGSTLTATERKAMLAASLLLLKLAAHEPLAAETATVAFR